MVQIPGMSPSDRTDSFIKIVASSIDELQLLIDRLTPLCRDYNIAGPFIGSQLPDSRTATNERIALVIETHELRC
jgi:hypothetical protein